MNWSIRRAKRWKAVITVPGDKSISHRALMLGALSDGKTVVTRLAPGKDVQSTASCLSRLGVRIDRDGGEAVVWGRGSHGFEAPAKILDAGNSGTTIRLLSGILAAQPFTSSITGDASLRRRPMKRVIEPLQAMGAKIETLPGFLAPITIHGTRLCPIDYVLPVPSAQVKSCVLLAGLLTGGKTSVTRTGSFARPHGADVRTSRNPV